MKDDLEHKAEVTEPVASRRKFIRTAAMASGVALTSVKLISARQSTGKAAQVVLPPPRRT